MSVCDVCGGAMTPFHGRKLETFRCASCGFFRLSPAEWERWLEAHGEYYEEEGIPATLDARRTFIRHRAAQAARRSSCGAAAELGAGLGETAAALAAAGFDVEAVEDSAMAFEAGRKAFPQVRWVREDVLGFLARQPSDRFALLTLYHCLEHVPDPARVCREAFRALRSGGTLVVEVPNAHSLQARLMGDRWHYFVPHHRSYFSEPTLKRLLEPMGFRHAGTERKYHFSHPQGVWWKDAVKHALARAGWDDIVCTYWRKP